MFEENQDPFSGFMPMINQMHISQETAMLNTDGDLVHAHTFTIKTRDGSDHVFSIANNDLMRLCFLIMKIINMD